MQPANAPGLQRRVRRTPTSEASAVRGARLGSFSGVTEGEKTVHTGVAVVQDCQLASLMGVVRPLSEYILEC